MVDPLLSRILGLLLVWEGAVLGLLISLPKRGWKIIRRLMNGPVL